MLVRTYFLQPSHHGILTSWLILVLALLVSYRRLLLLTGAHEIAYGIYATRAFNGLVVIFTIIAVFHENDNFIVYLTKYVILGDIFPDGLAAREINQLVIFCPKGCKTEIQLCKVEQHLLTCEKSIETRQDSSKLGYTCRECGELLSPEFYQKLGQHELYCPNVKVACPFFNAGCSEPIRRADLPQHLELQVAIIKINYTLL